MAERNKRASQYIKDNREALIAEWEKVAKLKVSAARKAEPLVLRDHLPAILEELHIALDKIGPEIDGRHAGTSGFTRERSVQHGRQRASTQSYTIDQVLHEFIILRHVLTDSLASNDLASRETLEAVDRVVELGLLESAAAFTDSIQQVQQQLLGTLAHDIRTPLSIAHTSLELLDNAHLPQAETEEVRAMARRGIKRALDMLKELQTP